MINAQLELVPGISPSDLVGDGNHTPWPAEQPVEEDVALAAGAHDDLRRRGGK